MPRPRRPPLPRRRTPRQRRARLTVDSLVEATARVLVARGWAATTTNHVAARAGVSIGSLYEYFPDKAALVAAVLDRHLTAAEARLAEVAAALAARRPTLPALVRAIVAAMIELHAAAPRLHRVLFEEVPHGPAVRRRVRALEDAQATALATALRGLAPGADPVVTARVVVELLEALTHRWVVADERPVPPARMARELERLVLAYLRTSDRAGRRARTAA